MEESESVEENVWNGKPAVASHEIQEPKYESIYSIYTKYRMFYCIEVGIVLLEVVYGTYMFTRYLPT